MSNVRKFLIGIVLGAIGVLILSSFIIPAISQANTPRKPNNVTFTGYRNGMITTIIDMDVPDDEKTRIEQEADAFINSLTHEQLHELTYESDRETLILLRQDDYPEYQRVMDEIKQEAPNKYNRLVKEIEIDGMNINDIMTEKGIE